MTRHYLSEDIAQIQRYFPGAEPVAIRTPFDITPKPRRIIADVFRPEQPPQTWRNILNWSA